MKKSLLTLTAALLASSAVFAADVTHPFYQPEKGGFLSDTSVMYQNFNHGAKYDETVTQGLLASETLTYGITRKLAVTGTLANIWDLQGRVKKHDNIVNPAWSVGVKYNLIDCEKSNLKVQVGADYTQGTLSWNPMLSSGLFFDHQQKEFSGYAKIGYQATEAFIPYVEGSIIKPVGKNEEDPYYTARAAGYATLSDLISVDAGLDYVWGSAKHYGSGHAKVFGVDTAVNFKLTDTLSLAVKGAYVFDMKLGGEDVNDKDYYTVGMNLKVAF